MEGLKEMLLQEENRLERILQRTREQLKNVPGGTLRLSNSGKWVQYYHCIPGERKITKDYVDNEIEKIFLNEHIERQKLIRPVEPEWEQLLNSWMSEDYTRKEFQEGTPIILTERDRKSVV